MLHSRLLRYLDEVARCGSIRQAADKLNVASSAINRQILSYEDEIGVQIFERLPRGMRLTTAGEAIIAHVRETLKEHRRLAARLSDLRGLKGGEVSVGCAAGPTSAFMPRIIRTFRAQFPGAQVTVNVETAERIVSGVANGDMDLGLAFDLPQDVHLHIIASVNCRLGAVVRPDHDLAGKASARLGDCLPYPLIFPDESLTLRSLLDYAFAGGGIEVHPACISNSIEFMKQAVLLNGGVAFLNESDIMEEKSSGALVHIPLTDSLLKLQTLKLVQRSRSTLEPIASRLAEHIKIALSEIGER